jgi:hypothetical protein
MAGQNHQKINQLERELAEGLLVDTGWFSARGYSRQLLNHYVATGWLEQPARGVYRRQRGTIKWQQAIISLQTLLDCPLLIGGRTALELQGYAHYLRQSADEVHLYGPYPPPNWLHKLPIDARFRYHNDRRLFRPAQNEPQTRGRGAAGASQTRGAAEWDKANAILQPWGQWDWSIRLSTPERALLELLDELPSREGFESVDKLMEGLANLSPRRLQTLLAACTNVKVKRLFFFFADRHHHAWTKHLKRDAIDLGTGKRMLVKGGKLDPTYQITVPGDLHGVQ